VAFVCGQCQAAIYAPAENPGGEAACSACGRSEPLRAADPGPGARRVEHCLRCGIDRLYVQKDLNRKVGLWVFVVAALLSVPTWGLSLLAATIVDATLYYVLGDVTICYACGAQHRGFERNPDHGAFDLHVAESVEARARAVVVGEADQVRT
jgi:hypothetical protein